MPPRLYRARCFMAWTSAVVLAGAAVASTVLARPASSPAVRPTIGLLHGSLTGTQINGNGSISGTVTGNSTGLTGICVVVDNGTGGPPSFATSTNTGAYTLSNLPPGSYVIRFDNNNDCSSTPDTGSWVTQWYSGASSFQNGTPVAVTANTTTPNINATMAAGGSISGSVTGPTTGTALQNICAVVDTGQFGPGGSQSIAASTASNGTYQLNNLPTGQTYRIRFDNNHDCRAPQANPGSWITQWWNNQSSFNNANPIPSSGTLTSTPVTGINANMAPGGIIAGKVINAANGSNLQGICVSAQLQNQNGGGGFPASAQTGADGTYSLNNLGSGTYQVSFNGCQGSSGSWVQQFWESASSQSTATLVNVTAPTTVTAIDAAMVAGGTITGTVTGGGVPQQGICVSVDTGQPSRFGGGSSLNTSTDNSGNYSLLGVPVGHSYKIRFDNNRNCPSQGNIGSWVTQWYNGCSQPCAGSSTFIGASAVSVSSLTPVPNINATMTQGGSIAGTVTNNGAGLSGVCAAVDPGLPGEVVTQQSQTRGDGSYVLNNLAAGHYKVRFDGYSCSFNNNGATQWTTQWWTGCTALPCAPASSTWAGGTTAVVTAGTPTTNIDATLTSGAGGISGNVVQAAGGQPLSGMCVTALNGSGRVTGATSAGQFFGNGANYLIQGLPAASYHVRFDSCNGGAGRWVTQLSASEAVTGGNTHTNVNANMVAIALFALSPTGGTTAGGTSVVITGSGLSNATSVLFGTAAGTGLSILSDNLIVITTPPHAAGPVAVAVTTPASNGGKSNIVTFTYS